jgi:hypothetical protein
MGNRTEYILSSMSAPKFDTSAFSNASNQFGNALNVGVRQMDELNKGKSLAYANDYVSGLLGKGDRTSVLAAQGMLPYANERYGKQAENLMGDIRHSEQMKQARDLFDITNKLEKDKLAEDIRVHDLTNKYQMGSLGIQGGQLSELIRHNKAGEKAISDQYASALNNQLSKLVKVVSTGPDGKVNVSTVTTATLLQNPNRYKAYDDWKSQQDANIPKAQLAEREKFLTGLQNEDKLTVDKFKSYLNAYANKDNSFWKTSIPPSKLNAMYNDYASMVKSNPVLMNTLITASGDENKGAAMFDMLGKKMNNGSWYQRMFAPIRNELAPRLLGETDPFGISLSAKQVMEQKLKDKKSSYWKAKANELKQ